MENILNRPFVIFFVAFFVLWLAAWIGGQVKRRQAEMSDDTRSDFGVVLGATLTLLGLIIGFSFSMATARYDLRKAYEEAEANAIGTEYVRLDLLPETDAAPLRTMLKRYTDLRIEFYRAHIGDELNEINTETARLQDKLWTGVAQPANAAPTPVKALAVGGMNDVLNSQGYTQAAWWNRIPVGAWCLMFGIALFCNALMGYGARRGEPKLLMILPLVAAVSFFLIADIDSPRGGVIRVAPQNLLSLRAGLGTP
jgi:hypothetical protein